MDEAEQYQQRLQAIAEKRRIQEEEEKVRRETEEEWLKLAQHKRKSLREQWLMETSPTTAEDLNLQFVIPTPHSTEQSAEKKQSSERQIQKGAETPENMDEESSQTGDNEPSIHSTGSREKPLQAYLGDEEENVLRVLEADVERNLLLKAAEEDTEEKGEANLEEQEIDQFSLDVVESADQPHHTLQQNKAPDEAHFNFAKNTDQISAEDDDAVVEEDEWEMVNCIPEVMDLMLTQPLTDTDLSDKGNVLNVDQDFIMDEEEDLEVNAPEVVSVIVTKKSDLEDTSCESRSERSRVESQTLCLEMGTHAGTSVPVQEPSNVSDIVSEEPLVYSVECKQNVPHLPSHPIHSLEEIGDNREYKGDQNMSTKLEKKETPGPEDEVFQHISLDIKKDKSPSMLQRDIGAQSTEQESEMQVLMPHSVTPNRAKTVTLSKRKTCHCCTVM